MKYNGKPDTALCSSKRNSVKSKKYKFGQHHSNSLFEQLFEQTPYTYEINGKTIAIVKKNTQSQEKKFV